MTLEGPMITAQGTATGLSVHLRVLATTDLHAHLLPYDYFTDKRAHGTGLACLGEMIAAARQAAPNVLLLDNGDTLQGAALADAATEVIVPGGRPHPMIAAMSALGFDAATLGNHDFDFGLAHLEASLATARFPVVSANTSRSDGSEYVPRRVALDRQVIDQQGNPHTLRIGVTGALPPQVARWNKPHLQGQLVFEDIVTSVKAQVAALKQEGADIVVVLAHSGFGVLDAGPRAENVALQVASLPDVDAVVAGHTHRLRPEVGQPTEDTTATLVQPGAFGSHLGCIDLLLQRPEDQPDAPWRVKNARTANFAANQRKSVGALRLRRILLDYPALRTQIARDHVATRAFVARPLGRTAVTLETYFSTLAPCAATQVVADAQFAAARSLIEDHSELRGLPVLSCVAPFKSGGRSGPTSYTDIPAGPLKLRHAADLYLYPNMLSILRLPGAGVREWLERSASIYRQIDPNGDKPQSLIDPDFAPYNFDRIVGLTYDIDVSRPARTSADGDVVYDTAGRIRDMRYANGERLQDAEEVLVITNSYRSAGGGYMEAAANAEEVILAPFSVRDAVAQFMSDAVPAIDPAVPPNFRLRPLGGVQVEFATGPGALGHDVRMAELGLVPRTSRAEDRTGFQRFALSL